MKKNRNILLVIFIIFIASCTKSETTPETSSSSGACSLSGSDILKTTMTPPSGASSDNYSSDGPGGRRILLATSSDGISFTRTGTVLTDQGNTPNMIVDTDGRILIYYTAYGIDGGAASNDGANKDGIAVAVSNDQGSTWTYYCVGMSGFDSGHPPIGDPDVIVNDDGTYTMYVTNGGANNQIFIYYATSSDGLQFTKGGTSLDTSSSDYKDSLTAKIGSTWQMYVLHSSDGKMLRATSSDGKTFTSGTTLEYTISVNGTTEPFVLSNWFKISSSSYRIFAFSGSTKDIRSYTTTDGITLTADSTVSLGLPLYSKEKSWVKDAAVQRLSNGTYLMAYVSEIP